MKKTIGAIMLALIATLTPAANPLNARTRVHTLPHAFMATCFCKISNEPLGGKTSATGVLMDLTDEVNKTYNGAYQQGEVNQNDCNIRCKNTAAAYVKSQNIAASACASGVPDLSLIEAFSAVGTKAYRSAQRIGILRNQPEVTSTTCTCPTGWMSNTTNVAGGVTTDGNCKKQAGTITITPLPPNGTPIGTLGFTWGNGVFMYGSTANGGAATCITSVLLPATCIWKP